MRSLAIAEPIETLLRLGDEARVTFDGADLGGELRRDGGDVTGAAPISSTRSLEPISAASSMKATM
jgi:hypothetical protein